ncbi:hypothetical protein [Candidatus Albibeggiatoa sp. nov. NOAA]|uniref:XAC2610-related protein n=1 Tax=Candidatus Albibeggiatoa sp. nov. NOAA TaxID=3162724 RepID=UPI0032F16216|nr:hypothetical protein [Thiotrichaceae bacterium]
MKYRIWLVLSLVFLHVPFGLAKTHTITEAWVSLGQTKNQCPDLYDYFPKGGMLSFYCHAKGLLDLNDLQKMADMPVFLSGPHKNNLPDLEAGQDFAHYNPEFVQWLTENLIPAADDEELRELTQPFYDQYVQPLARTYYQSYQSLQENADYFAEETKLYADAVKKRQLPDYYYEKFYDFADLYESGYNGNVVKGAVAFWIRRNVDGTIDQFVAGLEKLLSTYDAGFLNQAKPAQSPQSLAEIWVNLDKIYQQTDTRCEQEQTWFHDLGMRGFYCHLKSGLSFKQLQALAPMPIFLSSPHQNNQLNLNSRFSFGHYNPEFVNWLNNNVIPANPSPAFLKATQGFYDDYIKPLARTYYMVHHILQANPEFKNTELRRYEDLILTQKLPEFYTSHTYLTLRSKYPELEEFTRDNYEVASAMTFWLRRLMDGTEDEFIQVLKKLLLTYDKILLDQFSLPTNDPLTFRFEFNSYQADPFWVVDEIHIYDTDNQLTQKLDGFQAEQLGSATEMYNLEKNDFNFDGHDDIRLPQFLPTENLSFFYWLYDPEQNKYVRHTTLEKMDYVDFDPPSKTIINHWIKDEQNYGEDTYRYTSFKEIELVKQVLSKKVSNKTLVTTLERNEASGEMEVTDIDLR